MKIVERGLMSKEDLEEVERRALSLFAFGQVIIILFHSSIAIWKYSIGLGNFHAYISL